MEQPQQTPKSPAPKSSAPTPPKPDDQGPKFRKEHIKLIGLGLAAVILLVVFAQNLDQTKVMILFMPITMPLSVLLILVAVLGYLAGVFSAGILRRRKRRNAG